MGLQPPIYNRTEHDRGQTLRNVGAVAVAICGGFAVIFLFFAAMGAVPIGDALVATVIALLMAAVWGVSFLYRQTHESGRAEWRDRERRGF